MRHPNPKRRGGGSRRTRWIFVPLALSAVLAGTAPVAAQTGSSAAHNHGHPKQMSHEHGPTVTAVPMDPGADPVLLTGMGDHSLGQVSDNPLAQAYFDQGLMMAYAFNHPEAAVVFAHAARLDPSCVLCAWGEALVLGPNINAAMEDGVVEQAFRASREAEARLTATSSALERDLVGALLERYERAGSGDRSDLDLRYAAAMETLAERHGADDDVQALCADALMSTMPWDYWDAAGAPKPATLNVIRALDAALEANLRHPLANHLFIHLWEKNEPLKAVPAAQRLEGMAPAAGHLVHMPAHIYIRVGRYADAVIANQRAIVADQAYLAQSGTEGLYRIGYVPHNVHFLWAAATLAGRGHTALDAADRLGGQIDPALLTVPGLDNILQDYLVTPLLARVRFGKWEEVLAAPLMDEVLLYPRGIQAYARAVALARTGRLDEARAEVAQVTALAADPRMEDFKIWGVNSAASVLGIAARVARAEVEATSGAVDSAIEVLAEAVRIEDALLYQEPETWHHPVRQVLGQVLFDAGRFAEAAQVYRDDLAKYPENGWSLYGLHAALTQMGEDVEALEVADRLKKAFRDADIDLSASRF